MSDLKIKWKCYRDCDAKGLRKGRIEAWVDGELVYSKKCFILFAGWWAKKATRQKAAIALKVFVLLQASG